MSSLLQFNGKITRQGVHLQFIHVTPSTKTLNGVEYLKDTPQCGNTTDGVCVPGGKFYPRIWTAVRKPAGMFGPWCVFRYNGQENVPDLSVPISVFSLPRDARPLSNQETIKVWTT